MYKAKKSQMTMKETILLAKKILKTKKFKSRAPAFEK